MQLPDEQPAMEGDETPRIRVEVVHDARVNLAQQQNDIPVVKQLRLTNEGAVAVDDLLIRVVIADEISRPWQERVATLSPGGTHNFDRVDLLLDPARLRARNERELTILSAEVIADGKVLAQVEKKIEVLAWNEWGGLAVLPELISAFVVPNAAATETILSAARPHLKRLCGHDAFSGYQSKDPSRVVAMVEAVWLALQERNLGYVNPPASFEEVGQKIRLPDDLLRGGMGTCIDLVVMMASVLEQAGLHPLVILTQGHAMAGVWTSETSFADAALDEVSLVLNRIPLEEILVFETTRLTAGKNSSFAEARRVANQTLEKREDFLCVVDVARARSLHLRPLPLEGEPLPAPRPAAAVEAAAEVVGAPETPHTSGFPLAPSSVLVPERGPARVETWKRKLLDLSLNNRLLKLRETAKTLPLLVPDLARLEDMMQEGVSFLIAPPPEIVKKDGPRDLHALEDRVGEDVLEELIGAEMEKSLLTANVGGDALDTRLTKLFREARSTEQETGSNGLFLVLGMLEWYETDTSKDLCRAPILLLPARLTRRSGRQGFTVALTGEDPRINVTLLEKMRVEFALDVDGLDEIPEDESGIDVPRVLQRFRDRIKNVPRWSVREDAWLGILHFRKFALWRDLQVHSQSLLQSPVVAHLVERSGAPFDEGVSWPEAERLDELAVDDLVCPMDADSSQLSAVQAAAEGRSFVLQGPPGTGKSQTITNLIANALSRGQRVLFVAEKAAALDVVQRRLESVGLGPACLAVHSTKGGKREVIEQIRRAFEWEAIAPSEDDDLQIRELETLRDALNGYVQEIHARHPLGQSVFEVVGRLCELGEGTKTPPQREDPAAITREEAASLREKVAAWATAARAVGLRDDHPLCSVALEEWYPGLEDEAQSALQALREATERLTELRRDLGGSGGFLPETAPDVCATGLEAEAHIARVLVDHPGTPSALIVEEGWPELRPELEERIAHGLERDTKKHLILTGWRESFLEEDPDHWRARMAHADRGWGPIGWWRRRKIAKDLREFTREGRKVIVGSALRGTLDNLETFQRRRRELSGAAASLERFFGRRYLDEAPDWERAETMVIHADHFRTALRFFSDAYGDAAPNVRERILRLSGEERDRLADGPLRTRLKALQTSFKAWRKAREALGNLMIIDLEEAFGARSEHGALERQRERVDGMIAGMRGLRDWCGYRRARTALVQGGLEALVDLAEGARLDPNSAVEVYERGLLSSWLNTIIRRSERLRRFSRDEHQRKLDRFVELDARLIEANAAVARARVSAGMPKPSASTAGETGLLQRELKKKARHLPLRVLFTRLPNLLPRLKPCLLMSPLSVAQYLGPEWPKADLVVFDEASQMPVWDAIGALGRGSAAVVVGDSKQLPPTAFFSQSGEVEEDDAADEEIKDLESILDEFDASGFTSRRLRWHYRSRHESLIVFSNHHYYENDLVTFPSPQGPGEALGVRLQAVPDGVYDRGKTRCNRQEAEAIVAEVTRRVLAALEREEHPSIGIVAFSKQQASLIEDLLDEARGKHPEMEAVFAHEEEPLFVKNLENVQGDERDAILFSICYGPDAKGFIGMNFGPLNTAGGERRLNVAITRARRELIVFSTLRADQIDLRRTRSEAIKHLRTFLDFAARGTTAINEATATRDDEIYRRPIFRSIETALQERGHEVELGIGCSQQRIGLSILHPDGSGAHVLGIDCDGPSYRAYATARDRDRIRGGVLERLGWRLHRVWATDWWHDPVRECERIEAALADALRSFPTEGEEARREAQDAEPGTDSEPEVIDVPSVPPTVHQVVPDEPAGAAEDEEVPSVAPEKEAEEAAPTEEEPPRLMAEAVADGPRIEGEFYRRFELPADAVAEDADALGDLIPRIVAAEGPILVELLQRRVGQACQRARLTAGFKKIAAAAAERCEAAGAIRRAGDSWWAPDTDAATWRGRRAPDPTDDAPRGIAEVPILELANAAEAVLTEAYGIGEDQLIKETASFFGTARVGTKVKERLSQAVEQLVTEGRALRQGDTIGLP